MGKYLVILLGGGLGALSRYLLATFITVKVATSFPFGTLLINLLGSFVIGFCFELFQTKAVASHIQIFMTIGFLGAFTTFSTYTLETINLLRAGEYRLGLINIVGSNLLGIVFVIAGLIACKELLKLLK